MASGRCCPAASPWGSATWTPCERELARGDVAAFVVEPVQGKGVNLPPDGYLQSAQRLCRDAGALFVCDEVQTGVGRTGRFLALEHWALEPDMICVAKALSGGLVPIGAVLVSRGAFEKVFDGMERAVRHGSTFGGNDLAAAAALATLRVLDREGLVARAERMGALLLELTTPLVERYEVVRDVRGLGLMWAIEFGPPGGRVAPLAVGGGRAPPARPVLPAHHRAAVPRAPDPLPGGRPSHEHDQGAARAEIEEEEIRRFAAALEETIAAAERYPSALARFGLRTVSRAGTAKLQR